MTTTNPSGRGVCDTYCAHCSKEVQCATFDFASNTTVNSPCGHPAGMVLIPRRAA